MSATIGADHAVQGPLDIEKAHRPWKHDGYPAFSKWMASSKDFFIVRRFSRTSARVLLWMQYRIAEKERKVDAMDWFTMSLPGDKGGCGSFRLDEGSPREQVIKELAPLLKDYYDLLEAFSAVKDRPTAQDHQVRNLQAWLKNHPGAIDQQEREFADRRGDLIAISGSLKPAFRRLVERLPGLHYIFPVRAREDRLKTGTTFYYSERALETASNSFIILVGLLMLFGPLWWLNFVGDPVNRLGITTGFVLLFALLLASATVAKPFETLAATAAYAAVLMVFFQNNQASTAT